MSNSVITGTKEYFRTLLFVLIKQVCLYYIIELISVFNDYIIISCLEYLYSFSLLFYSYLSLGSYELSCQNIQYSLQTLLCYLMSNWSFIRPYILFLLPVGTWEYHGKPQST